ncbi:MCE family protein [Amycolatopsis sp. K13G38]|uniref:MCE family protein n=1 Tax=Amycolatopsis acididurans TaxID=2724524 RepID=A0ABX1JAV0_9PSEU|nr:MlaD family protein [Amycolatopsis acididurans]NKQ55480.1 MCE family protein [Amycolatopsis acididurans]
MNSKVKRVLKIGAVVAVVAAAAAGYLASQSSSDSVEVTAVFADASPLIPGNLIRMDGVDVGEIEAVTLRNGQANVQMKLDRSVLPLHQDASAKIRPVTLLGERYIDLDRGSANAPEMSSPRLIAAAHTTRAVDLDEVLDSLDDPTSTALAALVTTLGEGTAGQGPDVDAAIKALAPAMTDTRQLTDILNGQNAVLGQLVDRATPIAQAVSGDQGKNLDKAVDAGNRMLAAVAAQRQAMQDALQQLPGTLRTAQRVLGEAAGVAQEGTPALQSLRPLTGNLVDVNAELNAFADSANPALSSLPAVLDRAKSLLDQAAPLVRDLRPGGAVLPGASASANRLVGDLTPALGTALDFMKYWAMSTNGRDALGNYFRAFVVTTPKSLLQIPGTGLGPATQSAPAPAPAPAPSPALPNLPVQVMPPGGDPGSATGLTQPQENNLLGQLLGGL